MLLIVESSLYGVFLELCVFHSTICWRKISIFRPFRFYSILWPFWVNTTIERRIENGFCCEFVSWIRIQGPNDILTLVTRGVISVFLTPNGEFRTIYYKHRPAYLKTRQKGLKVPKEKNKFRKKSLEFWAEFLWKYQPSSSMQKQFPSLRLLACFCCRPDAKSRASER